MKKAMLRALIGGAIAIALVPSASRAATGPIVAAHHAFVPSVVVIQAGEEVSFTNGDLALHSVTSSSWDPATGAPLFDSGPVAIAQTAAVAGAAALAPNAVGYEFHCMVHPDMQGTLIVV